MATAIMRLAGTKHKTTAGGKTGGSGSLGGYDKHNDRTYDSPHADPTLTQYNYHVIGSGNTHQDFIDHCVNHDIDPEKPCRQKDQIYAFDAMFTASPDFWQHDQNLAHGWDQKQIDQFVDGVQSFLNKEFPGQCISLEVHLDETSPHIHAMLVPTIERTNKKTGEHEHVISYKDVLGGSKFQLSDMQNSYHDHVKHLGLERGTVGSKAKHQKPGRYYSEQAAKEEKALEAAREAAEQAKNTIDKAPSSLTQKAKEALTGSYQEKLKELIDAQSKLIASKQQELNTVKADLTARVAAAEGRAEKERIRANTAQKDIEQSMRPGVFTRIKNKYMELKKELKEKTAQVLKLSKRLEEKDKEIKRANDIADHYRERAMQFEAQVLDQNKSFNEIYGAKLQKLEDEVRAAQERELQLIMLAHTAALDSPDPGISTYINSEISRIEKYDAEAVRKEREEPEPEPIKITRREPVHQQRNHEYDRGFSR
ncbi:hypothetical protein ABIE61_003352 [Marinobacterium sp. MBR-111]|jgi:hypothetical protein|uniref:MobV family relaxase n=1 Tax=Marinobacterium sp. MBR-111 TaxID=3156463 RepID=UPI0033961902